MYVRDCRLPTDHDGSFRLYVFGDGHIDREAFDEGRFIRFRKLLERDPHGVGFFVGDIAECRVPGVKHFNTKTLRKDYRLNMDDYVEFTKAHAVRLFQPIRAAGRPLFMGEGNHDRYLQWQGIMGAIAGAVGAQYVGGEGMVRIRSGKPGREYTTRVYMTHGHGGGRMPGSKVNGLVALRGVADADVYIAGHVHDGYTTVRGYPTVASRGALDLRVQTCAFLRAPSFLRGRLKDMVGYDGEYAFPPTDNRLFVLRWNPKQDDPERRAVVEYVDSLAAAA